MAKKNKSLSPAQKRRINIIKKIAQEKDFYALVYGNKYLWIERRKPNQKSYRLDLTKPSDRKLFDLF